MYALEENYWVIHLAALCRVDSIRELESRFTGRELQLFTGTDAMKHANAVSWLS